MNKEFEQIEIALNRHGKDFNKLVNKVTAYFFIIMILGVFAYMTYVYGSVEEAKFHWDYYLGLILIVASVQLFIFLIGIWIFQRKNVVNDIVDISGYIHKNKNTTYINGQTIVANYYYVDIVTCNKEIRTVIFSSFQYKAIRRLVADNAPDKLYEFKAAVLEPNSVSILDKSLKNGVLVLLPLEKHLPKVSLF